MKANQEKHKNKLHKSQFLKVNKDNISQENQKPKDFLISFKLEFNSEDFHEYEMQ